MVPSPPEYENVKCKRTVPTMYRDGDVSGDGDGVVHSRHAVTVQATPRRFPRTSKYKFPRATPQRSQMNPEARSGTSASRLVESVPLTL